MSQSASSPSRTPVVVDPNPMKDIIKRAEQLRSEASDGILYPCGLCQKVFKFKYEYERHAKIHSGDRPWQCSECLKTFSRKDNMRAHMKIHTGELVRHECQMCGKSYGRKYDLQVHERVHSGERPFQCASCGKSFISTSRLRAHQLIHCKNIYLPRHVRNKGAVVVATEVQLSPPLSPPMSVEDVKPPKLALAVGAAAAAAADSDSPVDSPDCSRQSVCADDAVCQIDIEEKMQQLEAVLMQRKAELEERGIKVEIDAMLDLNSHLLEEEHFHIVLPEPCKAEPVDCFVDTR